MTPSNRSWKRPLIIIGAAYALLEIALYGVLPRRPAAMDAIPFYFDRAPALDHSIMRSKIHGLLTSKEPPYDALYLGDCSCLMNVDPLTLEKKTGLRGLNLGTIAYLYTDGFTDIVELYLERYPPPKVVVYYLTPWVLTTPYATIQHVGVLKKFRDWCGIPSFNPLSRLPSYKAWYIIKAQFSKWRTRPGAFTEPRAEFPSDNDFQQIMVRNHGYMPEVQQYAWKPEKTPSFVPDSLAGLKRVFALAEKHSFKVLVMMHPIPESHRSAQTDAAYREFQDRLAALEARYPSSVELGKSWLRYYPDAMFKTHNLHLDGIRQNSEDISRELNEVMGKPHEPYE